MIQILLRLRYLAVIVALILSVHAVGLIALGSFRAYQAYQLVAQGPAAWQGQDRPGIHIAESVDAVLFALVLIVLALGSAYLFLSTEKAEKGLPLPGWVKVKNLTELKLLLWEGILLLLVVMTLTSLVANVDNLNWIHLILPVAILILSLSYYLLKRAAPTSEAE